MKTFLGACAVAAVVLTVPASASVAYSNGPALGIGGWAINSTTEVADSFILLSNQSLMDVNFGAELLTGDTGTNVNWAIVLDPTNIAGTTLFSGSAALTQTFLGPSSPGYDVDNENFTLPNGVTLATGTYWLVLTNMTTAGGNTAFWDENDGPSQAWQSNLGFLTQANAPGSCNVPGPGYCSEAFSIDNTLPEPGSLALGGVGLVFLGFLRRKIKR
jgi:hypothetical protein